VVKSRLGLAAASSGYLPRLDLQAKYYHDDPDFLDYDLDRKNWTVGLMLNWQIFSGFLTPAKIDQSRAMLREMLAADRQTVQTIQLDLKSALLEREQARARVEVTSKSVGQAEESLRLVQIEYEGGSATITRYLNAQLARDRARVNAVTAVYDLKKAQANLGRALGHWSNLPSSIPE